jgi:hypothetical protein
MKHTENRIYTFASLYSVRGTDIINIAGTYVMMTTGAIGNTYCALNELLGPVVYTPALYSGGPGFKSQPGYRLF